MVSGVPPMEPAVLLVDVERRRCRRGGAGGWRLVPSGGGSGGPGPARSRRRCRRTARTSRPARRRRTATDPRPARLATVAVGQVGELRQPGCRDHAGFVDDDGGAHREVVAVIGWPVEAMFDEELVDRVGRQPGLGASTSAAVADGGDPEHRPTVREELLDGGGEGGGLAGAGRADDHHQIVVAGDRRGACAWTAFNGRRGSECGRRGGPGRCAAFGGRPRPNRPLPGRGWLGW